MAKHDVIVIGASAGGLEAIIHLCQNLPKDLPASVFIVLHTAPSSPGLIPEILRRYTSLTALYPKQGDEIRPGTIYVAPPNRHLLVHPDTIEISSGPRENLLRPSVDILFRSAAEAFGPRVVGVVLSGTRNDGTAGLQEIQHKGGVAIAQDPHEALFPGMPESAIQNLPIDYVLTVAEIAKTLNDLAHSSNEVRKQAFPMSPGMGKENKIIRADKENFVKTDNGSERTIMTCPECGGTLWEMHEGNIIRFVCHVGHAFSEDSLDEGQSEAIEKALWTALRALEERVALSIRLANRAKDQGKTLVSKQFQKQAESADHDAEVLRALLLNGRVFGPAEHEAQSEERQ